MNKCNLHQKQKGFAFDEKIEYNPEKKLLKKPLSFWCLVDTDIVFFIALVFRFLLLYLKCYIALLGTQKRDIDLFLGAKDNFLCLIFFS